MFRMNKPAFPDHLQFDCRLYTMLLMLMLYCIPCPAREDYEISIEVTSEDTAAPEENYVEIESGDESNAPAEAGDEAELPPIEQLPELTGFVPAEYPEEIHKQGIEGVVLMDLLVSDSGSVDSVHVVKSLHPVLDSNAVRAARQFVFTPAIAGDGSVPVILQYEYRYTLREVVEKIEKYINFKGVLIERGTRKPVADAMVVLTFSDTTADTALPVPFSRYMIQIASYAGQFLEAGKLVTITDSLGRFSFTSLPEGEVEVSVPTAGYEEFEETEFIRSDIELDVKYYIKRESYSEYEIVVYGKAEKKEVAKRQLTLNEIKKIPGLDGDAVKVVQALPGVARPTFGGPQIVVRGAATSNSRFFIDGIDIPQLFHFGLKSTYNSDALQSVDFYPGGFGARYGNALAGVIELTGRKPKTDRWHGYADASFTDGSIFVEGPLNDKFSILAEGRRSFIGELIKLGVENTQSRSAATVAPFYWDYILRTDGDINKTNHAYLTFFGSKDALKFVTNNVRGGSEGVDEATNAINTELIFNMAILGWDVDLRDELTNRLRLSLGYQDVSLSAFGFFKNEVFSYQYYLRDQLSWEPSEQLAVNFGIDANYSPLDITLIFPDGENNFRKDTTENWGFSDIAAYVNFEWTLYDRLTLLPGIRYDYFDELRHNGSILPEFWEYENFDNRRGPSGEPSVRLTARYQVAENHIAKAALGSYSQTPQPEGQAIHPVWGNPNLPATKGAQGVVGHEWQISDLISSDLQLYYNTQWNVARTPTDQELGPDVKPFLGDGKSRMFGMEILLRHDQGTRFFGWLAYSLSRSLRWSFADNKYVLFGKDQTHNLILVGSWRLPANWEFGFKFQFTSGDPETPIIGYIYNENFHFNQTIDGERNSSRLAPTAQLDLRFDKKFIFKSWIYSIYVDFKNIGYFIYQSPQTTIYNDAEPYDYINEKPNKQGIALPSYPSIGLKAEF
ncbi:MAG: TonB family protein [Chitinivibrionales bacterium]|nr:TonB family protein [Chitinivibrionales bacterium]